MPSRWVMASCWIAIVGASTALAGERPYFTIEVVDEQTGRGVPLVELTTTHQVRLVTDSQGLVAFHEPGLTGQTVYFHIESHGYEYPQDGFGYRGRAFRIEEGGQATVTLKRLNIAERLYRVTGGGIYRDSLLVGRPAPIRQPTLNAQVFGSDSVVNALYRGKLHWFWGDTNRPGYPLGNFHVPGATSELPGQGGLDPEIGVDLTYFVNEATGFAAATAQLPGPGPTWINGLVALPDRDGRERLYCAYAKIKPPLDAYERGLAVFNDQDHRFEAVARFDLEAPIHPGGHPFLKTDEGRLYVMFANPYPVTRVPADADSLKDSSRYESFTCLQPETKAADGAIDRAPDGEIRYGWKRNTPPVGPQEQAKLIQSGALKPEEALLALRDVETGKPVLAHGGSVAWNEFRDRWVMIALEAFGGPSFLGEVWYAEADTPLGPWVYARKVVTHNKYSFYNPKQHPYFAKDGGRVIFFEGTYAHTFSGNPRQTPWYDYNQIMYKLSLDDSRLNLPAPIYDLGNGERFSARSAGHAVAWFALEQPRDDTVPVFEESDQPGRRRLRVGTPPEGLVPLFHALRADVEKPPAPTVPLHEFVSDDGRRAYGPADTAPAGFRRLDPPLARVWRNPMRLVMPAP